MISLFITGLIPMSEIIHGIYWVAGFIVFAEALNKLERTEPFKRGMQFRWRVVETMKAFAWMFLAVGGAGAMASPLISTTAPGAQDVCLALGFATLIVRTRIKEG